MKDGEYKCHECEGKGSIDITYTVLEHQVGESSIPCASCRGSGRVDWIQHAMKINKTMNYIKFSKFEQKKE